MSRPTDRHSYVQKVRDDTQRHLRDLLDENARLRRSLAAEESECTALEKEKLKLHSQVLDLREELTGTREELSRLRQRLAEAEGDNEAFAERSREIERQNNNLANLYVASYRLHETMERTEVLAAIQEIVINLIGSEELVIFERSPDGNGELRRIAAFGLAEGHFERVVVGEGIIGSAVARKTPHLAARTSTAGESRQPDEGDLTACIPLTVGVEVVGAIAIFRLLPQKVHGLVELDFELIDLLASQAGSALYTTSLHRQLTSHPPA